MVGVLLISHQGIGREMLATAATLFDPFPLPIRVLSISPQEDIEAARKRGLLLADEIARGEGLLILTDAFGSTPSNIASSILERYRPAHLVAGLSLPMLIRVLNYARLPLDELVIKAISGGHDGIVHCNDAGQCHAK